MKIKALAGTFVLQLLCLFSLTVQAQSTISADTGAAPGFDYDEALALSQAAIGRKVGDVSFTAADGRRLRLSDLQGKPLVLSMVYTSCYQICPMTTQYLSQMVEKARDALGEDSFAVALVGFDVHLDTPAAMQYFANKQGISSKGWNLLSISQNEVQRLVADIGFQYIPSANGFDHLIQATIIDAEGRVYRQVYGQVFDTPLLVDPLIELVLGRSPPEQPVLAGLISKIKLFCTTYDPSRDAYFFDYSLFIGMFIGGFIIILTVVAVVRGARNVAP